MGISRHVENGHKNDCAFGGSCDPRIFFNETFESSEVSAGGKISRRSDRSKVRYHKENGSARGEPGQETVQDGADSLKPARLN